MAFFGGLGAWMVWDTRESVDWLFVACLVILFGIVGLLVVGRVLWPQRVDVFRGAIRVPSGRVWERQTLSVPFEDVLLVQLLEYSGQTFVVFETPGGEVRLNRVLFPAGSDFDRFVEFLLAGEATDSDARPHPSSPGTAFAARVRSEYRAGFLWDLALRLGVMTCAFGGPLRLHDVLAPTLGDPTAFAVAMSAPGLLLLGGFSLAYDRPTRWSKVAVRVGFLGGLVVVGLGVWAVAGIVSGPRGADDGLIIFGVAGGLLCVAAYAVLARRFFEDA